MRVRRDELNANPDMASMMNNLDKDDTLKSQLGNPQPPQPPQPHPLISHPISKQLNGFYRPYGI